MEISYPTPFRLALSVATVLFCVGMLSSSCGIPTHEELPVSEGFSAIGLPESPVVAPSADPTGASDLDVYRSSSALESFPLALESARTWNPEAEWYGIFPYTSMARFLALPVMDDHPAWHYRFSSPDGAEYLVEVLDGEVIAQNEIAIPAYIEPALQNLLPIDESWSGLDSSDVLAIYAEQPDSLLARYPQMKLDYRLSHPRDRAEPVWTVYDAEDLTGPVLAVNAASGAVLQNE